MTSNEAYEYMENEIRCIQRSKICDRDCAKCELVKEDKPLIEAYGVVIEALEKQMPEKVHRYNGGMHHCECGAIVKSYYNYCNECGQALDWSDIE